MRARQPGNVASVGVPIAVFDLDKTLTVRDCVVPFMRRAGGNVRVVVTALRHGPTIIRLLFRRDRDALKRLFVKGVLAGLTVDEVDTLGLEFAGVISASWMRADVADRLRWHQEQDHIVLIVSASLAPYVEPLGDFLEVDGVLCTRLASRDGVLTGELVGENCRGPEKVERIRQWCADSGVTLASVLFAYGDSTGDREMLEIAEHGQMVKTGDLDRVPA